MARRLEIPGDAHGHFDLSPWPGGGTATGGAAVFPRGVAPLCVDCDGGAAVVAGNFPATPAPGIAGRYFRRAQADRNRSGTPDGPALPLAFVARNPRREELGDHDSLRRRHSRATRSRGKRDRGKRKHGKRRAEERDGIPSRREIGNARAGCAGGISPLAGAGAAASLGLFSGCVDPRAGRTRGAGDRGFRVPDGRGGAGACRDLARAFFRAEDPLSGVPWRRVRPAQPALSRVWWRTADDRPGCLFPGGSEGMQAVRQTAPARCRHNFQRCFCTHCGAHLDEARP